MEAIYITRLPPVLREKKLISIIHILVYENAYLLSQ